MEPVLRDAGEGTAVENVCPRRVARIAEIGVGPGRGQVQPRRHFELGAQLHAAVAGLPRVLEEHAAGGGGGRIRVSDQLVPYLRVEQRHRVVQPTYEVAAHADLVVRGFLRSQDRVEATRGVGLVRELGGGRRLERGPDVAIHGDGVGGRDGDSDRPGQRAHQPASRVVGVGRGDQSIVRPEVDPIVA